MTLWLMHLLESKVWHLHRLWLSKVSDDLMQHCWCECIGSFQLPGSPIYRWLLLIKVALILHIQYQHSLLCHHHVGAIKKSIFLCLKFVYGRYKMNWIIKKEKKKTEKNTVSISSIVIKGWIYFNKFLVWIFFMIIIIFSHCFTMDIKKGLKCILVSENIINFGSDF